MSARASRIRGAFGVSRTPCLHTAGVGGARVPVPLIKLLQPPHMGRAAATAACSACAAAGGGGGSHDGFRSISSDVTESISGEELKERREESRSRTRGHVLGTRLQG